MKDQTKRAPKVGQESATSAPVERIIQIMPATGWYLIHKFRYYRQEPLAAWGVTQSGAVIALELNDLELAPIKRYYIEEDDCEGPALEYFQTLAEADANYVGLRQINTRLRRENEREKAAKKDKA